METVTDFFSDFSIAEILSNLQTECIDKYPGDRAKVKLCQELAAVYVQIPPSIFKGMEDLAWPIPDGICALIFKCQMNCCGVNDPPEQVHLSYVANDHTMMGVSWVTLSDKLSVVQYGQSKNFMTSFTHGDISTYLAGSWHGTIHRAIMTDLKPSTTYYYRVGNGERWSETLSFTTLSSEQESATAPVRYAILADMDFESNATMANLASLVQAKKIDAIIHSGDISYADGYEPHWDVFLRRMQSVVSSVPFMVTPGNHEFWFNFTSYKHRFLMPGDKELVEKLAQHRIAGSDDLQFGSHDGMFYSWTVGPVHFIAGNSETAIDTANFSPEFISWLEADLASVDRTKTPFIVFHFHRPMYCSNSDRCTSGGGDLLRSKAEDLLMKYQVNMVIQGHIHSYERTYPMYQSQATSLNYDAPTAPVYVVQGASGNREGNDGFPSELPAWSAARASDVGYGILTASATELTFDYYVSSFDGAKLIDSFTVKPWAAAAKH